MTVPIDLAIPFNSINDDRIFFAEDVAKMFGTVMTDGVHPNPGSSFFVSAAGGWTLNIAAGRCVINNGYIGVSDTVKQVTLDAPDGIRPRIDRIMLRWDISIRDIVITVSKGVASASPVPNVPQRDADAYELCVAQVYVAAAATGITQGDITDTRQNSALCGTINSLIKVDPDTLFAQWTAIWDEWITRYKDLTAQEYAAFEAAIAGHTQNAQAIYNTYTEMLEQNERTYFEALRTWFEGFKASSEDDFYTWFDALQEILDENEAANLLSMIIGLTDRVTLIEAVLFNDIDDNPFVIQFDDLDGLEVAGVWNQVLRRIEC